MKLVNMILDREKIPEEWRKSVLVLMFKNKDVVQACAMGQQQRDKADELQN